MNEFLDQSDQLNSEYCAWFGTRPPWTEDDVKLDGVLAMYVVKEIFYTKIFRPDMTHKAFLPPNKQQLL